MAVTKKQIDNVAVDVLKRYIEHNHCEWRVFSVDPFELAKMLGIDIEFSNLGAHNAIAYTYATDTPTSIEYFYDEYDDELSLELDGNTIVVNSDLSDDKTGLLNMAVMYCVAIQIIHRLYKMVDYGACLSFSDEDDLTETDLWEIATLTKELLMPTSILQKLFHNAYGNDHLDTLNAVLHKENYLKFCAISTLFKVTPDVLAIRCQQLRLLDNYIMSTE